MTHDILVVGAGPAGLTTAISAARCGARVLVVERHAGTSIFPRATGVSARSMEIFRSWASTTSSGPSCAYRRCARFRRRC